MARATQRAAGKVLRVGEEGQGGAHEEVPELDCQRELRHTQKEEEEEGTHRRFVAWQDLFTHSQDSVFFLRIRIYIIKDRDIYKDIKM